MASTICPKGHPSTDPDFCSECGAKMLPSGKCPDCGTFAGIDVVFCEVCGYNFVTRAHGELAVVMSPAQATEAHIAGAQLQQQAHVPLPPNPDPPLPEPPVPEPPMPEPPAPEVDLHTATPPPAPAAAPGLGWTLVVTVDPSLREAGSPPAPTNATALAIDLKKDVNLIGRTSQSRAIFPEVALDADDAVSHRHALLQVDGAGQLILRDIGSANGTRLNGREVQALTDVPLHDRDELTLGHWTRIAVKAMR